MYFILSNGARGGDSTALPKILFGENQGKIP